MRHGMRAVDASQPGAHASLALAMRKFGARAPKR
jgi:hypothetical protein